MAITTPDAVPGEVIEAAWGDAVRADLTSHDTQIAARLPKTAGVSHPLSGHLYVGNDPNTSDGALVRTDGVIQSSVMGPGTALTTESLSLTRATAPASDVGGIFVGFHRSAGGPGGSSLIGSVTINTGGSSILYNTTSDERLKNELGDLDDTTAFSAVAALRPIRFIWIGDDTNTEVAGFLAHEVAEAGIPEAVTGERGAVDGEGKIVPQQLDVTRLIPYLVAAVQSLAARVATLEGS